MFIPAPPLPYALSPPALVSSGKKVSGKMVLRTGSSIGFQAQVWYLQPVAELLTGDSSLPTVCAEYRGTRALPPPPRWHKTQEYNTTRGLCLSNSCASCSPWHQQYLHSDSNNPSHCASTPRAIPCFSGSCSSSTGGPGRGLAR